MLAPALAAASKAAQQSADIAKVTSVSRTKSGKLKPRGAKSAAQKAITASANDRGEQERPDKKRRR